MTEKEPSVVDELIEKAASEIAQQEWSELWDTPVSELNVEKAKKIIEEAGGAQTFFVGDNPETP